MKKVTFKCEIITPLFLGEAKKGIVELRTPAIKAAMRFWWRAMHAHLSPEDMKKREGEIFGGGGNKAQSAKFDIVLSDPNNPPVPYDYDPHQGDSIRKIEDINKGIGSGIQYLMYTFFLKKKGMYFRPNIQFDVTFFFDNDNTHINQILASFWLLVFLGNIGERSRRGFGSFKVTDITDNERLIGNFNFTTYNLEAIRAGLTLIKSPTVFNSAAATLENNTFSHIFYNEIFVSNTMQRTWKEALNDIGSKMKAFRLDVNNRALLSEYDSAIFGLPIKHHGNFTIKPKDFERRASPLIIKNIQVGTNEFRWVLIRLEGDFLPVGNDKLNEPSIRKVGQFTLAVYLKADDTVLTQFLDPINLNMTKI